MRFITDANTFTVVLDGWEKVWALKSRVVVPRAAISDLAYVPARPVLQDFRGYFRVPGTAIPWRFLAGTFWRKGDREFWYMRMRHEGVLTVELKAGQLSYKRLRVSCDPAEAQSVLDWWRQTSREA